MKHYKPLKPFEGKKSLSLQVLEIRYNKVLKYVNSGVPMEISLSGIHKTKDVNNFISKQIRNNILFLNASKTKLSFVQGE